MTAEVEQHITAEEEHRLVLSDVLSEKQDGLLMSRSGPLAPIRPLVSTAEQSSNRVELRLRGVGTPLGVVAVDEDDTLSELRQAIYAQVEVRNLPPRYAFARPNGVCFKVSAESTRRVADLGPVVFLEPRSVPGALPPRGRAIAVAKAKLAIEAALTTGGDAELSTAAAPMRAAWERTPTERIRAKTREKQWQEVVEEEPSFTMDDETQVDILSLRRPQSVVASRRLRKTIMEAKRTRELARELFSVVQVYTDAAAVVIQRLERGRSKRKVCVALLRKKAFKAIAQRRSLTEDREQTGVTSWQAYVQTSSGRDEQTLLVLNSARQLTSQITPKKASAVEDDCSSFGSGRPSFTINRPSFTIAEEKEHDDDDESSHGSVTTPREAAPAPGVVRKVSLRPGDLEEVSPAAEEDPAPSRDFVTHAAISRHGSRQLVRLDADEGGRLDDGGRGSVLPDGGRGSMLARRPSLKEKRASQEQSVPELRRASKPTKFQGEYGGDALLTRGVLLDDVNAICTVRATADGYSVSAFFSGTGRQQQVLVTAETLSVERPSDPKAVAAYLLTRLAIAGGKISIKVQDDPPVEKQEVAIVDGSIDVHDDPPAVEEPAVQPASVEQPPVEEQEKAPTIVDGSIGIEVHDDPPVEKQEEAIGIKVHEPVVEEQGPAACRVEAPPPTPPPLTLDAALEERAVAPPPPAASFFTRKLRTQSGRRSNRDHLDVPSVVGFDAGDPLDAKMSNKRTPVRHSSRRASSFIGQRLPEAEEACSPAPSSSFEATAPQRSTRDTREDLKNDGGDDDDEGGASPHSHYVEGPAPASPDPASPDERLGSNPASSALPSPAPSPPANRHYF